MKKLLYIKYYLIYINNIDNIKLKNDITDKEMNKLLSIKISDYDKDSNDLLLQKL